MTRFQQFFKKKMLSWVKKRASAGNPYTLNSKHIYILPSSFGFAFIIALITLTIGAINYQLNPGFILAFFMVSLTLLAMWESHRNLKGLTLNCLTIEDIEQGQPGKISIVVSAETSIRYGLTFCCQRQLKSDPLF